MRVLMHVCCAPCATFPASLLRSEGIVVDGVFLNPNIAPNEEAVKRWESCVRLERLESFKIRKADTSHMAWKDAVSSDLRRPGRCCLCYSHRLSAVARMAIEEGYDGFTTSLLVSPYQDHKGIKIAGDRAALAAGIPFIYRDFRVGYRRSREMARGMHLYMQKYCGCEFSLAEREG